jgi:hypothetical protein
MADPLSKPWTITPRGRKQGPFLLASPLGNEDRPDAYEIEMEAHGRVSRAARLLREDDRWVLKPSRKLGMPAATVESGPEEDIARIALRMLSAWIQANRPDLATEVPVIPPAEEGR